MRRYCFMLLASLPLLVEAQTSAYEDRLVDNLARVDAWQGYLQDYPAKPNVAPPGDVPGLARAVAEIFVAFHDDHVSEHEVRLREEFDATVIRGVVDQYPIIEDRLAETSRLLAAGRAADPVAFDFRLERLVELVEWHYFALPLLLYEGQTPYHAMYREATALYEQYANRSAPGIDLARVTWPAVDAGDLGATEVVSITERRRREEAARAGRQEALAAEIERENVARAAATAASAQAAQAEARREVAQELARVEALMADSASNVASSGGGFGFFGFLLLILASAAALAFAAVRGWLPPEVSKRVLAIVDRLRHAIQTRRSGGLTDAS